MPSYDAPHFRFPFTWGKDGHAQCVEQDTSEDVYQCVEALIRTPRGFRLELPDYGISDPTFSEGEPDTSDIQSAIEIYEPRARADIDLSNDEEVDALAWTIMADISGGED